MKRALGESLLVVIVGVTIALVANAIRSDGIPLGSDPRSLRVGAGIPLVDAGGAHQAFEDGAIFIDARPRAAYLASHVEGALSIPPENAEAAYREAHEFIPQDGPVIVYAAAAEASIAGTRATWLRTMGHAGATVMVDGWEAWERGGYPVASGE